MMERFSIPIAATSGKGTKFILNIPEEKPINYIVIQEDIKSGERVRSYTIEARVNGKWQVVCEGESIGQKRIQPFTKLNTNKLRLTVGNFTMKPEIKSFSAYFIESQE
jgi:alpha-L-fucosidase